MKTYIAGRACKLGGVQYKIGDTVANSTIDPKRIWQLKNFGILVEVDAPEPVKRPARRVKAADSSGDVQL